MATSDEPDYSEFERCVRTGDDSSPLMNLVPEPPPNHWGTITSQARTTSPQYLQFLARNRESRDGRERR